MLSLKQFLPVVFGAFYVHPQLESELVALHACCAYRLHYWNEAYSLYLLILGLHAVVPELHYTTIKHKLVCKIRAALLKNCSPADTCKHLEKISLENIWFAFLLVKAQMVVLHHNFFHHYHTTKQ